MRAVLILAILLGFSERVAGQSLSLSGPTNFYEAYLDEPQTRTRAGLVGHVIVGIRLGDIPQPFLARDIAVHTGQHQDGLENVCLRFLSRDGRYFARGVYGLAPNSGPSSLVKFHTQYANRLDAYATNDIAISAFYSNDCNESTAGYRFATSQDASANAESVVVQLRAGDARLTAQLGRNNAPSGIAVLCHPTTTTGPTIGFTHECVLPFPASTTSGVYELRIGETGSDGGIKVKTYSMVLQSRTEGPQ
ncbi:hypothetical protein ACVIGA_008799 [Bradyrhizobium sp. USDA 3240]